MKKTRYLDHIDLRVSDLKRAHKFYGKLLPALGFSCDRSSGRWRIFYAAGGDKQVCRAYSRGFYACFFEDPDGNKLEICCRESPIIPD